MKQKAPGLVSDIDRSLPQGHNCPAVATEFSVALHGILSAARLVDASKGFPNPSINEENRPDRRRIYLMRFLFGLIILSVGCSYPAREKDNSKRQPPEDVGNTARSTAHEIFVVPERFLGGVVTLYSQAQGTSSKSVGDTVIYEVPSNGVVRVRASAPGPSTTTTVVIAGAPSAPMRAFQTCEEMRLKNSTRKSEVGFCWLPQMGGTAAPDNIAFVVTDWDHIPDLYDRAMFLVDSTVFGGKNRPLKWTEPKSRPVDPSLKQYAPTPPGPTL